MNKTIYSYTACRFNSLFLINTTSKWYNASRWFRTDLGRNRYCGVWILVMNKALRAVETSYCMYLGGNRQTHRWDPFLRPFLKRLSVTHIVFVHITTTSWPLFRGGTRVSRNLLMKLYFIIRVEISYAVMRFEVLTAVTMKSNAFQDVAPWRRNFVDMLLGPCVP
jgi:hypothetical protein